MDRTVTAFFDSREEAEAAKSRLQSSNIDADRIRIIDKSSGSSGGTSGYGSSNDGGRSPSDSGSERGFFSSLTNMFMPHEDKHAYQEGLNRGGFLLCAEVDDREADEAVRILDQSNSVDFDERQEQWRGEGWAGWTGGSMGNQHVSSSGTPMTAGSGQQGFSGQGGQQGFSAQGGQQGFSEQGGQQAFSGQAGQQQYAGATGQTVGEEHIPIVEEELRIGKREVNRGGAKVRSYVREVPVHEQVSLREEHVEVERRPVNQQIDPAEAGNLLQERTIEMTETAEEAVVGKEAHVAEEVVVRKTAEEHVEQIDDTVRKTEVDFDDAGRTGSGSGSGSAFGFKDRDRDGTPDRIDSDMDRTNDPAFRR